MAKYKKRADGRYAKQIVTGTKADGKPILKYIYGYTQKELEDNVRNYLNLRDHGVTTSAKDLTVNQLITAWEKKKLNEKISDGTYRIIQKETKKIAAFMGNMKVVDVKPFHVESFIESASKGIKETTANVTILRTKEMFRYAMQKELIYRSPAEFIKPFPVKKSAKRMLTQHEKDLFDQAPLTDYERCFISVLRYSGMRRGEVFALSTSDIDFNDNTISVKQTMVDGRGKPYRQEYTKTVAGMRVIPLLEPLRPILKGYCSGRIGLLFAKENGKLPESCHVSLIWKRIIEKVRLLDKDIADDITPHIFRHTFCSDLYYAGIDIKRAQYIMGHETVSTTLNIYTHLDNEKIKLDEMNTYYNKSKTSQQELGNS